MSKSDLSELPGEVEGLCQALVAGLKNELGEDLYGVYLYGAIAFPNGGRVQDIDGHVIVGTPLTDDDRKRVGRLHEGLAREFPSVVGDGLDVYYILLKEAAGAPSPRDQLRTDVFDQSWALHCAHIRAGRFIPLYGPDPRTVYPQPTWPELVTALEGELRYVEEHLNTYPGYSVLQLCRLMFSFKNKDVVVSKRSAAEWALAQFPSWQRLIGAALRSYASEGKTRNWQPLDSEVNHFLRFARDRIKEYTVTSGAA